MKKIIDDYEGCVIDLDKEEKNNGTIEFEGQKLYLLQSAYPSDLCGHEDEYVASAIDKNGKRYTITWDIINFETEDGADTCNWDNYTVSIL